MQLPSQHLGRVRVYLIALTCASMGCGKVLTSDDYLKTVRSAKDALPIAVQMEQLFPECDHFITHYGMDDRTIWNTEVFFGDRYTLTMQVDVEIDYESNKIAKTIGDAKLYLVEVEWVKMLSEGRTESSSGDHLEFTSKEWQDVYKGNGDFSLIGFAIKPGKVAHFQDYVTSVRRDRVPVVSLK